MLAREFVLLLSGFIFGVGGYAFGVTSACAEALASVGAPIIGTSASVRDGPLAFPAMMELGIQSVRMDVPWSLVEAESGKYQIPQWVEDTVNTTRSYGMQPLLVLAYGNKLYGGDKPRSPVAIAAFARYASFVTAHFKGKVRYFELWNEWETHTGKTTPGSPADYLALAKVAYPAIKAANPDATVLMSGIADITQNNSIGGPEWITQYIGLGGLRYVDALSVHAYTQPGDEQTPGAAIKRIDGIEERARRSTGDSEVPIYITEMGYTTYSGRIGVSPQQATEYTARFILLAGARPYIKGLWWYGLEDLGSDPSDMDHHWGVFARDFSPKPQAQAFAAAVSLLQEYPERREDVSPKGVRIALMKGNQSRFVWWDSKSTTLTRGESPKTGTEPLVNLGTVKKPVAR